MTRRRAIRLLLLGALCLLLGAATTVGVAWWCMFPNPAPDRFGGTLNPSADRYSWPRWIRGQRPVPTSGTTEHGWGFSSESVFHSADPGASPGGGDLVVTTESSGWPMRALWRGDDSSREDAWMFDGGEPGWTLLDKPGGLLWVWADGPGWPEPQTQMTDGVQRWGITRLPINPLWTGLAFDTALYASAWYLLIFAPLPLYRAGRRRFRVSRGMCGACGYDLKGSPGGACPECGKGAES